MRKLAIILNVLIIIISCKNSKIKENNHNNDTVFIEKDNNLGNKQSIYFEQNENSIFYNELNQFIFDKFDKETYAFSLKNLKKLNKRKPIINQTKWVPLHLYKKKYYVYKPCDFFTFYKASINDSTFIDWTGEGAIANKIIKQKKIDNSTYEFELSSRKLEIKIIDSVKGIAIFKDVESNQGNEYLMVDAKKIKLFPLIVNNCETNKQSELDFEKIDFEKLKNNYR